MKYHEMADHEKTPVNLDGSLENADWTKTKSWDLGGPRQIEHVLYSIIAGGFPKTNDIVQSRLDIFMQSPAGRAMPEPHRARLRKLGYRVDPLVR